MGHYQTGIIRTPNLADMIQIMLAKKAGNRSILNAKTYLQEIGDFFGRSTKLNRISEVKIQAFREYLDVRPRRDGKPGNLSPKTKNNVLKELDHLLKTAAAKRYILDAPEISLYRDNGARDYNLSLANFWKLFHALPLEPKPFRAILLMGLYTGQRRGDLLSMTKDQVRNGLIRFKSSKTG